MIVEIFKKGTNPAFTQHIDTLWTITDIKVDNDEFILGTGYYPHLVERISAKEYELRVSY